MSGRRNEVSRVTQVDPTSVPGSRRRGSGATGRRVRISVIGRRDCSAHPIDPRMP
jgi:hypothetical protein